MFIDFSKTTNLNISAKDIEACCNRPYTIAEDLLRVKLPHKNKVKVIAKFDIVNINGVETLVYIPDRI